MSLSSITYASKELILCPFFYLLKVLSPLVYQFRSKFPDALTIWASITWAQWRYSAGLASSDANLSLFGQSRNYSEQVLLHLSKSERQEFNPRDIGCQYQWYDKPNVRISPGADLPQYLNLHINFEWIYRKIISGFTSRNIIFSFRGREDVRVCMFMCVCVSKGGKKRGGEGLQSDL